jgi:hypothetical protein
MTSRSTAAPAGWYLDPSLPDLERYWDGAAWQPYLRPVGGRAPSGADPALDTGEMPVVPGDGGGRRSRGLAPVAAVLGIAALAVLLQEVVWGAF